MIQFQFSRHFALLAALVGFASTASSVSAQPPAVGESPHATDWRVQSHPDLDLWFHGLAVVGFEGYGPLRMYDADYIRKISAAKKRMELAPTLLDRRAAALKVAFDRDSTFEVMHFLPLYFIGSRSGDIFADLRDITRENSSRRTGEGQPGNTGVAAARSVFSTPARRKTLANFLDALDAERRDFYREYSMQQSPGNREITRLFAQSWDDSILPSLSPFLNTVRIRSGIVFLSPAIGGEGRSIRMRATGPGNFSSSIVVVGMPRSRSDYLLPAASLVRELCFVVVHGVLNATQPGITDRILAERLSSVTAVRCGDQAIEKYLPSLSTSYQTLFLQSLGAHVPRTDLPAAFRAAFPVPPGVDAGLRRALAEQ